MGCYKAETRWIITRLAGYAAYALHQVSSIDVSEALMFNYLLLTILHLSADPSVLLGLSAVLESMKISIYIVLAKLCTVMVFYGGSFRNIGS